MSTRTRRKWKLERASVTLRRKKRSRSNKFSGGDVTKRPAAHSRNKVWVGGYVRRTGRKIAGYFRHAA